MRLLLVALTFIFLLTSKSYSVTKFDIDGFTIGMVLADKLTDNQIKEGSIRNWYNTKYVKTIEFEKSSYLPNYDFYQFSFKKKDKKDKIISIQVIKDYKDNIAECFFDRDQIIEDIKKKMKKRITYVEDMGTKEFSKSYAKGTRTTTWIDLKGKKSIFVSCYNFAESEVDRVDHLRMGVENSYFGKYAFKK